MSDVKSPAAEIAALYSQLDELSLVEAHRLRGSLDGLRRGGRGGARIDTRSEDLARIAARIEAARQRVLDRRLSVPALRYPEQLPVSQRKDEILEAIRDHQVVIVAGETGSGKTTQIPKICLELGRGVRGQIGHTQPRRIAARTVAERIAEELGIELGGAVGYQVRFTAASSDRTLVKLMTDGILLAELGRDRMLRRYDTLIIDEAHERSLNIDFLLGYVKHLLPRRPDLKVVITSATIETERFSQHFDGAPVIEVSGRTYPVEIRYRPVDDVDQDQAQAVGDAVDELIAAGDGDILVFCSGEREIRETADALGRRFGNSAGGGAGNGSGNGAGNNAGSGSGRAKPGIRCPEIVPLYARLSAAEQHRVFAPHTGLRIVLATNVAETSLTVPGIKYVIDQGTARISRYSTRLKVQRLPIEPISQASANQRAGRCGRTSDGICIRLYGEDDFAARPEYTDPEILRTNLASVMLQMTDLGLGEIEQFPFIDPPDPRRITDGWRLLEELGALVSGEQGPGRRTEPDGERGRRRLTDIGKRLARLPVDPRLGRMVIEAERNGCLQAVMVIVAALSIQDPRERPVEHQQAADASHARFADPGSDFVAYLNLWQYLRTEQKERSGSAFRRMCRTEFLNYLRVRQWQDLYSQLRQIVQTAGTPLGDPWPEQPSGADRQHLHVSLLPGLLSHIGVREEDRSKNAKGKGNGATPTRRGNDRAEFLGARNAKFAIFPGSALAKRPPAWVMAAELVETGRLWARIVAGIEPEWVESLAGHLVKRTYSEPRWDERRGAVLANERVTLYGVPIVAKRSVNYGRIDPVVSRDLFIRHALVQGEWQTHHAFVAANRAMLDEAEELEHRVRKRGLVADDEVVYAFFDQRIPADIVSVRHFDRWWKQHRRQQPDLLTFDRAMLFAAAAAGSGGSFPGTLRMPPVGHAGNGGHGQPGVEPIELNLSYRFDPSSPSDGVTVEIPLGLLNQVDAELLGWQVPGFREDLVIALLRSLPKQLRRSIVPVPDFARAALAGLPVSGNLLTALERRLYELAAVVIPREAWQFDRVPPHLVMNVAVIDTDGSRLAEGKDLGAIRERLRDRVRAELSTAASGLTRSGMRGWDIDELPRLVRSTDSGPAVTGYPALVDRGDSVAVEVLETPSEQASAMLAGTRRLLTLSIGSPVKLVNARLSNQTKLALSRNPHRNAADLLDDCVGCAVDALVERAGGPAWDAEGFAKLTAAVRPALAETVLTVVNRVAPILSAAHEVSTAIERRRAVPGSPMVTEALADLRGQLDAMVYRGFVTDTGLAQLTHLPRYLTAMLRRIERLAAATQRDRDRMFVVHDVQDAYQQMRRTIDKGGPAAAGLVDIRWMIEELRVNLFAQALGTPYSISEKRIYRAMDALETVAG